MSVIKQVKKCYRCGNILQSEDENAKGYVNQSIIESAPFGVMLLCDECRNKQSEDNVGEPNVPEDLLRMIECASLTDSLIVYIIDSFNFECSFSTKIIDLIKHLNVLVVANKADLFPKYKLPSLRSFVSHRFRSKGINVRDEDVFLASLSSLGDVSQIKNEIEKRRNGHDVYAIGARNSGQTFFLNAYLRDYSNVSTRYVTTKEFAGKGGKYLQIPLDMSATLYQTPPLSLSNSILGMMGLESALSIMPKEAIKARKASLKAGEGLFIGPLAYIYYGKGNHKHVELNIYASQALEISKINNDDRFRAFAKIKKNCDLELKIEELNYYDVYDIAIDENTKRDIGIAGLGFISFLGNNQKFRVYVPRGVAIYTCRSKMN